MNPDPFSTSQQRSIDPLQDIVDQVEIVLVAYRSRAHVEELVEQWPPALRTIVVDNAGNADGLRDWAAGRANVRYLDGGGQGFARAANAGAFASECPFVIFVNPDCRPSMENLKELVEGLRRDTGAASHAATMTGHDGSIEAGVGGWEPTLRRLVVHALGLSGALPQAGLFLSASPGRSYDVNWTTGACMAVRMSDFRRLGGFDELFFVYAEDVSFGRAARREGLRTVLRPDVMVRHGAGSSGAPSLEMLRLRGASFGGYLQRYHGWRALPMRALMVLGAVLRAGGAVVRRRRDVLQQQRAFIEGLVTLHAYVGNREVAHQRYIEVTGSH